MRILITGAASGIGYELGKKLSKVGHLVYFTVRCESQVDTLKEKMKEEGVEGVCFSLDITNDRDLEKLDKIKIDCLVNNAAIGVGGSILYMDIEHLKKNFDVNFFSSFKVLKRVYRNMEKDHIKGKLFVISSMSLVMPIPYLGCYTSSKAAISQLTKTIRGELKDIKSNISITLVEPGAYKTGFNQIMIDNKEMYLEKNCKIYKNVENINNKQRKLFDLIESKNIDGLVNKIVREIESSKPKFRIKAPLIQNIFLKIYALFTM